MKALRELVLGARMALAGGASGWLRAGFTALGVGLGVALLLVAVSAPNAIASRSERNAARDDVSFAEPPPRSESTVLVARADTQFRDKSIRGRLLQPEGADPALPPGLSAIPGPGEMAVSPALARLLESPDAQLLRERLNYRVAATIGDVGLSGPAELAFYLGSADLDETSNAVTRRASFGEPRTSQRLDPVLSLLVVVMVVVLLLPVGLFVAAAVLFGGDARDRRLAGVRLLGADARMARRIGAGEALGSSLLGLVVGGAIFLIGRSFVDRVELFRISVFPADLRPDPLLALVLLAAVPAAAVAVTVASLRRAVIEPFGVSRASGGGRRSVWWRFLLPVFGLALLLPMLGTLSGGGDGFSTPQVSAGLILVLVGVAALLPWAVQAAVRRVEGGPVAWQLAVRRLQLDPSTSARAVMGIAVAVAGAIGLQTLFTSVEAAYTQVTGADPDRAEVLVELPVRDGWSGLHRVGAQLGAVPGVVSVHSRASVTGAVPPPAGEADDSGELTVVTVADCAALRELAELGSCTEGDVFRLAPSESNDFTAAPEPGAPIVFGAGRAEAAVEWSVPPTARTVTGRPDPSGVSAWGLLATPTAVPDAMLAGRELSVFSYVDVDGDDPNLIELLRTALWTMDPSGYLGANLTEAAADEFVAVRRGLLVGATATLMLIGVSLLVGVLEQLRERRRILASLVAFGTRRSTLAWSVLWQTAVPVALGLLLAVLAGMTVGATLLRIVGAPVTFDWGSVVLLTGIAAIVVLGVTALSLPALWRIMRADGLRTE